MSMFLFNSYLLYFVQIKIHVYMQQAPPSGIIIVHTIKCHMLHTHYLTKQGGCFIQTKHILQTVRRTNVICTCYNYHAQTHPQPRLLLYVNMYRTTCSHAYTHIHIYLTAVYTINREGYSSCHNCTYYTASLRIHRA